METNAHTIEVFPDKDNLWRWRAKASNGEIVASGEAYDSRSNALRAVEETFPGVAIVEKGRSED